MVDQVVIRYDVAVEAGPDQPAHMPGETFVVTDAAAAQAVHPFAVIVGYADGRAYDAPKPSKPARGED